MEKASGTHWLELGPKLGWRYAEEENVGLYQESNSSTLSPCLYPSHSADWATSAPILVK
jgi:hypothetical protein